jgi:hypothetical protein
VLDDECSTDSVCSITGACIAKTECLLDSDCPQVPDPMSCLEGRCDYSPACRGDTDCNKGSFCDDQNRCRGLISETLCKSDQDCRVACDSDQQ